VHEGVVHFQTGARQLRSLVLAGTHRRPRTFFVARDAFPEGAEHVLTIWANSHVVPNIIEHELLDLRSVGILSGHG
jgi:hypothetical protein